MHTLKIILWIENEVQPVMDAMDLTDGGTKVFCQKVAVGVEKKGRV